MSDSLSAIKHQLKQLKAEKGITSKSVGLAKKNGEDAHLLIEKVRALSQQIKALEGQLNELLTPVEIAPAPIERKIPKQFKPRLLKDEPDVDLRVISDLSDSAWDLYVDQHPNSTVYHTTPIKRVIIETFGHTTHYLAAIDNNDGVKGVLPLVEMKSRLFGHFLISVPFFNYGGILASSTQAADSLQQEARTLCEKLGAEHVEFRHTDNWLDLPSKSEKVAMILELPDSSETLWDQIGSKVRAQIKKAQKHGLEIRFGRQELVDDFYKVFSRNMRDLGTPVYAKQLFENMLKHNGNAEIVVQYLNRKPISCGFLLGWENTLEIPWASTIREANRFDANMLMYWEILNHAIEKKFTSFDFGRSTKNAKTFRFKKQWGAQPQTLTWHYHLIALSELPEINPSNIKYQLVIWVWKKLPLWLTNLIGPSTVRSIP